MAINLPSNEAIEKNILGIILLNPKEAFNILSSLDEEDFYANNLRQRYVYKAMVQLTEQNIPIDSGALFDQLAKTNTLERVGGEEYVSSLIDEVVSYTKKTIDNYINALQELTMLRNFLNELESAQKDFAKGGADDVSNFLARHEKALLDLTAKRKVSGFESLNDLSRQLGNKLETYKNPKDSITGFTTGFPTLDSWINGLNGGKLYVIAARTAMGKSAFALNVAYLNALKTNRPAAIFSLEMDAKEITARLIANRATVQMKNIQNGYLTPEERLRISGAVEEMQKVQLYIDDNSAIGIDDIILKAKKLKEDKGDLGLIVIDYIGLISEGKNKFSSEQEKLAYFSRRLKQTASELDCAVICLAQINRDTENNKANSRVPTLANIKSSDAIAADSDVVIFIYREDYYKKQGVIMDKGSSTDAKPLDESAINRSNNVNGEHAQIIVSKNRNGKTGRIDFLYFGPYLRFDEPDEETRRMMRRFENDEE